MQGLESWKSRGRGSFDTMTSFTMIGGLASKRVVASFPIETEIFSAEMCSRHSIPAAK